MKNSPKWSNHFLSMHIEGMCIGVDHKKFGKKIPTPWCASGAR
jgi:hypothetical protein